MHLPLPKALSWLPVSASLLASAALLTGCSSDFFYLPPEQGDSLGSNGAATVIETDDGFVCAVHNQAIKTDTGYRIARIEDFPDDRASTQLTNKYPNALPAEWSLEQSPIYRYPGPVEYCPTCQQAVSNSYQEAPPNTDDLPRQRYIPGPGGGTYITR